MTLKFYRLALHKKYFDQGFSVLNYAKYPIVLLGIAIPNVKAIIIIAILYALACYFIGRYWLLKGLLDAENEVQNHFNPFQREVRDALNKGTLVKRFK